MSNTDLEHCGNWDHVDSPNCPCYPEVQARSSEVLDVGYSTTVEIEDDTNDPQLQRFRAAFRRQDGGK